MHPSCQTLAINRVAKSSMGPISRISYKYRSGPAALRCLSEGTAYFASPSELNDSLEAKFDLAKTSDFLAATTSALNELAERRGLPGTYTFNEAAFQEFDAVHVSENQRFHEASQRVGIFSAAPRPDNQPMWAYYCENSKGVCFELEWSDDVLKRHQLWPTNVHYTKEARIHNRAEDLRQALLSVGDIHPEWNVQQILDFSLSDTFRRDWGIQTTARAVSTKHADWQHEAELRMLTPRHGPVPVMQDILKRVFFVRTDFPEWGSLMMLLHKLYPNVELAKISFEHKEPFVRVEPLHFKKVPVQP